MTRDGPAVSIRVVDGDDGDRRVDLRDRLIEFRFEDNAIKADKCILKLDNFDLSMLDDETWRRGQLMEVAWGYLGNMHPPRQVVVKKVRGSLVLTVECHAASVLLDREQKCRSFKNVTRSEVVREIARENGFSGSFLFVEDTNEVFDVITQNAETDARFLRRLAKKEGFSFYVDHTGFHWHDEESETTPTHVLIYYTDPGKGDILGFDVDVDLAHQPGRVRIRGRNPETGEAFESDGSDANTKRTELADEIEIVDPETGTTSVQKRVATGSIHHSAARNEKQAKREADARFKKASRNRIRLKLDTVGDPTLTAKRVIEVKGLGEYLSGKYYALVSTHIVNGNGYTQKLQTRRGTAKKIPGGKGKNSEADKNREPAIEDQETRNRLFERVDPVTGASTYHRRPVRKGT